MTPRVVTDRETFCDTAATAPPGARVPVEVRVRVADPFDAYCRAREGPGGAYLATTGGQPGWGYFGVEPAEFVEVTAADVVDRDAGEGKLGEGQLGEGKTEQGKMEDAVAGASAGTLDALAALVDGETLVRGACDVPYPCGAVGWLSYDLARELEALPTSAERDRALPRLQAAVYDRLAAWEAPQDGEVTLRVCACPPVGGERFASAAEAWAFGREHALALARRSVEGDPAVDAPPVASDRAAFVADTTREGFAERVRRVKELIRDGETFQANVSQRLAAPAAVHPVAAFEALRTVNPAPYSALLEFPGVDLISASPELLLERDGDRVRTEPIAGTRPRGATPAADERREANLLADEKERAEHAMLVDLERNDLGKVCAYGSVTVEEYRRVDRYSEVMHLVSSVAGRLRPDADLTDAIAAVFPGGTVTGAPKPRTMAIIDGVEPTRRGPYTGSIGLFGFDERATLNIVIRTLVRAGDEYTLRVGAGIVHDSDPGREYAETLDKGRALVQALDEALGDRADLAVEEPR
jgi:anthranilate synthase component 1